MPNTPDQFDSKSFFERGDLRSLRLVPFQTVVLAGGPGDYVSTFKLETNQFLYIEKASVHVFSTTNTGNPVNIRTDLVDMSFLVVSQDGVNVVNAYPTASVPPIVDARLMSLINTSSSLSVAGGTNDNFRFSGTGMFDIHRIVGPGGKFTVGVRVNSGVTLEYAFGGHLTAYVINQ